MKKLCIFLLICIYTSNAQTARNLIVLLDWEERIAKQLDNIEQEKRYMEAITGDLVTALAQKAALIITTSSLWHNFVVRRKIFEDFLAGQGLKYKNKYKRFNNATLKQFQQTIQSYFQPSGKNTSLHPHQAFLKLSSIEKELHDYFLCYAIPFQENDWIIKKASDYIYVLIPTSYLEKLKRLKNLEKSKELKKVFEELKKTFSKQNVNKQLSNDDLILGLKITAMPTMSYQDALNPEKHKLSIDKNKYAQLLTQKDMQLITKELPKKHITVPESFILSRHFINALKNIFVTQRELTDNKDAAKTDLYRALYLHKWHIYLSGHGGESVPGTLQDIDLSKINKLVYDELVWSRIAGMDLFAFRTWLAFLQSRIKTQFLFYTACYSGGHHLQKPFEHYWKYSAGATLKKEAKPDIFNYTIVTGNFKYTLTMTYLPIISIPYKKISRNKINIDFPVQFPLFFRALEKYFSQIGKTITLNEVIDYVHYTEECRPAVRYPGTDFFVPLPLDKKQEAIERLRYETDAEKKAREEEKKRIKKVIEQHISGESALIKVIRTLQQSFIQLKQAIQNQFLSSK